MKKTFFCAVLFLLISGVACVAQSDEPSLGDVARQHKAEVKRVKTLTNDDVATSHPSPSSDTATSTRGPAASSPSTGSSDKTDKKADSAKTPATAASKDTPEVAELKSKISSYKAEQDGWKRAAKRNQDLLANETSDFRRQMYQDALDGDQNNVQVFQDKIDQAQADLAKAEKSPR